MKIFRHNEPTAARRDIFVQMVSASDYVTPETGLTLTVEIVKAGGSAYAAIAGTASEIGNGTYKISLAQSDLDTVGSAMLKITDETSGATAAPQYVPIEVVDWTDWVYNVDSTGTETITAAKAIEAILAAVGGKAQVTDVDADTKRVEFFGRDGTTTILRVDVSTTGSGVRETSEIDPS